MKLLWDRYKKLFMASMAVVLFAHFPKLDARIVGIDTESIITDREGLLYAWGDSGRQGLVLLKKLLERGGYQPYFTAVVTLLILAMSVSAFFLLWDSTANAAGGQKADGKLAGDGWFVFCVLGAMVWIFHPIITEQLYFSLQSAEVCLGIGLTAVALFCVGLGSRNGRRGWPAYLAAFCILLLTFSIYQSFVEMYIFGTVSLVLLQAADKVGFFGGQQEDVNAKKLIGLTVPYILVFLAAFIGNACIIRLFFGMSSYLGNQIMWGQDSFGAVFCSVFSQIKSTFLGRSVAHYDVTYAIIAWFTAVLVSVTAIRHTKGKRGCLWPLLFYLFALHVTPYMILILCGGTLVVRSQLVMPALLGFQVYLDGRICIYEIQRIWAEKKPDRFQRGIAGGVAVLLCLFALGAAWRQLHVTMGLYYSEKMCYEQDARMAAELIEWIDRESGMDKLPVIMIGTRSLQGNASCITGETIGRSFFEHDADAEPRFYWSTRRALGFMKVMGKEYLGVTDSEQIENAMEISRYMPEWPYEGCVQQHDGMIIVKLSAFD